MKNFFVIAFLLWLPIQACSQSDPLTTFILIRHAEKASDGTRDPELSDIGKERANTLAKVLAESKLAAIITTPYKRTRNTVKVLAANMGVTVEDYDFNNTKLLQELLRKYKGQTIVVSGHSNTTPILVNKLIGEDKYQILEENEYDKIFVVTCTKIGNGKELILKY